MSEELQFQESGEKIFVSIRLRPLNDKSRNRLCDWECVSNDTILFKHNLPERAMFRTAYTFDRVFDSDCNTALVYEEGAKHIAVSVLDGINSSIFAYGQTSSGKTYTMRGITDHAVSDIYNYIENSKEREFMVKFCAMEIYNEAVRDLLSPDSYPLRVLDDPERGTVVEKLTEVNLRNREHLHELLSICEAQRQIGETALNETSSRSHQILRLTIESSAREYAGAGNSSILAASVNFVDLAGSERASQTLSAGARLKEGCHINRSLLTLGTVIRKLSKGKTGHIPYRDSKLTRILQNALGGNARTAIICTMSPERVHVEQSRNTLLFANCAKQVRTNAQVNLIMSDKALVKQLQRELARLEKEMRSLGSSSVQGDTSVMLREKEQLIGQMANEIQLLTWQRDLAQSRVENLLLSVREVQMLKQASNSSGVEFATVAPSVPGAENGCPGLVDNPEEGFLVDGMTPKFTGTDPCKSWETSEQMGQEFEDKSKDVQSVEIEESRNNMNEQEEKLTMTEVLPKETGANEGDDFSTDHEEKQGKIDTVITTNDNVVSSPGKEDLEPTPVYNDQTYKALKQKIQELQSTVKFLVNTQHLDQSPSFLNASSPMRRSLNRSKSCRAVVTSAPSSPFFDFEMAAHNESRLFSSGVGKDFLERSRDHYQMLSEMKHVNRGDNMSVRHSRASSVSSCSVDTLNLKDSDGEDTFTATNFPPRPNSTASAAGGSEMNQRSEKQIDNKIIIKADSEFEEKQRKIVELWEACRVSLIHRSYFIQLFKGDPSDCLYLEIELRRLTYLKDSLTDIASSEKELSRERAMVSKQIRRLSRRQREEVYKQWGIDLNTKQRSVQLANLVWRDAKDIAHVKASAALVAKLLGFVEPSRAPNEGVELCILPRFLSRRTNSWRLSLPSLF